MKQAKISITADTRGLKGQIENAKKQVEGLFKIKMSPQAANGFKKIIGDQLSQQVKSAEKELSGLQKRLEQVGKGSIINPKSLDHYIKRVNDLQIALDKAKKTQKGLGDIGSGKGGGGSGGGGGDDSGGGGGMLGKFSGLAKAAGLAMGAMAVYNRRLGMARERVAIKETGSQVGNESSLMGFTPEERRSRMLQTSQAAGRKLNRAEMTSLTDLGENVQRGFGISQSESTEAMKAGRKANQGDGDKFLSNTIGAAVAAKLEGSRIGEFLAASTSALEEMNQNGIGIATDSLNGFAGALSTLPFFKSDPAKAFDQIKGLADAFSNGDRFQQAQAGKAIQGAYAASGGQGTLDPAAIELRRENLFMDATNEQKKAMSPELRQAFSVKSEDIIKQMVSDAVNSTKGMGRTNQIMEVKTRLGLKGEAGSALADQLIDGKVDMKALRANAKGQTGTNNQMIAGAAANTMVGPDGDMLKINSKVQESFDKAADMLTNSIITLAGKIIALSEKFGGRDMMGDIGGAAIGIGTALVGAALLPKAAKSLIGKGAGAAMSMGRAGLAGAAGMTGLGATLNAGVGTLAAGGAAGIATLAGGVAIAGGAGYAAGKYIGNPLLDKYTSKKNRYGQSSNIVERGIGKVASWAGGISPEHYDSMYGDSGSDPLVDQTVVDAQQRIDLKKSSGAATPPIGSTPPVVKPIDDNTTATDLNTLAVAQLTAALTGGANGRAGGQPTVGRGAKVGSGGH